MAIQMLTLRQAWSGGDDNKKSECERQRDENSEEGATCCGNKITA